MLLHVLNATDATPVHQAAVYTIAPAFRGPHQNETVLAEFHTIILEQGTALIWLSHAYIIFLSCKRVTATLDVRHRVVLEGTQSY